MGAGDRRPEELTVCRWLTYIGSAVLAEGIRSSPLVEHVRKHDLPTAVDPSVEQHRRLAAARAAPENPHLAVVVPGSTRVVLRNGRDELHPFTPTSLVATA
jgi:hypothetical protein